MYFDVLNGLSDGRAIPGAIDGATLLVYDDIPFDRNLAVGYRHPLEACGSRPVTERLTQDMHIEQPRSSAGPSGRTPPRLQMNVR